MLLEKETKVQINIRYHPTCSIMYDLKKNYD